MSRTHHLLTFSRMFRIVASFFCVPPPSRYPMTLFEEVIRQRWPNLRLNIYHSRHDLASCVLLESHRCNPCSPRHG